MKKTTKHTFRIYGRHVKKYWGFMAVMVLSLGSVVILETIIPFFYKRFFDVLSGEVVTSDAQSTLIRIIIEILIMNGITWILFRVAIFTNNRFQPRVMADLANSTFHYLHQHSYNFFVNRFVGSLVRKVNRLVNSFEAIADRMYWDFFPMGIRILSILIVLFIYNFKIAVVILVWTIIYLVVNYIFTLYKLKYDEENAQIDSEVTGRLADTITNNVNIKLFSALGLERRVYRAHTERQCRMRTFVWDLEGYMEAVQAAFMIFLEFGVFYLAIRFWQQGLMTVGDFVLIQAYLFQIFHRLWDFGRVVRDMYRRLADAEEMTEILYTPHDIQDKPGAKKLVVKKGDIDFRDVSFTYTKTRDILDTFNFSIKAGEKVGLVGPSGSGKTTLTALLFRFYDVSGGGVYIDNQNIADVSQHSLRDAISLVPQDPILFHRTLLENVRYSKPGVSEKEVRRAARLAHCDDFIKRLPEGYKTYVGERGIKLSGGERQRVAIARAILKDAPILVLDEATSSLDSHSEILIQDALTKLMKGKTTIVIAHRLSTIMKMDRIVVVKNGAIEEEGSHSELLKKRGGLYKKLWELQAGGFIA